MSGYWATGSRLMETAPTMTKMIDTTAAKIGRSIKKCERRMGRLRFSIGFEVGSRGRRRGGGRSLRRNLETRPRPHQAVDNDVVIRVEPFADNPQAIDSRPERDVLCTCDVLGVHDEHELAHLFGGDGCLGYEQRGAWRCGSYLDARKHPRCEPAVKIGEERTCTDGA